MSLDPRKNFAKSTLSTGYNSSATSVVLTTGQGARFPAASFNAIWWNSTDYGDPSDDPNVEIVRVTAISTDTFTITRAQEGTSATNKNTAGKTYSLVASVSKKFFDDLDVLFANWTTASGATPSLTFTDAPTFIVGTITANTTWSMSGYALGRKMTLYLTPDTVTRTQSFPGFGWIEGTLAAVPANKNVVVYLECTDGTAGGVRATYGVQQ